jgi:hypothetical protein
MALLGAAQPAVAQTTVPSAPTSASTTRPTGATSSTPNPPATSTPSTGAPASTERTVSFGQARFTVPSTWPVYDLAADPSQCVRYDKPAVYLGHAGSQARCPAGLIGRADTLQIEAADATTASETVKASTPSTVAGVTVKMDPGAAADGQVRMLVPSIGLFVTLTRSPFVSSADHVLSSFQVDPSYGPPAAPPAAAVPKAAAPAVAAPAVAAPKTAAPAAAAPTTSAGPSATLQRGPTSYVGEGFDACAAPSESTMAAWLNSPYRSVGIYIGGALRACSQPNLTATWISDETNQGWLLTPIYVGLQAPCNSTLYSTINPAQADSQGRAAGADAASDAASLGLTVGSPVYFDMEGYDRTVPGCSLAVLAFLQGWTNELHARGYVSGVYGSSASTITDLVNQYSNPGYSVPDDIWFANWSCCPHSVTGDPYIPGADWSPHHRLHQYTGGHDETWGGVTVNIDADYDDGALTGAIPGYVLDGWGAAHAFGGGSLRSINYWPNQDVTRGLAIQPSGLGGYVLDDWGAVHPFGAAPGVASTGFWPGQDVTRALALDPCDPTGTSGYVLDMAGALWPFGGAPNIPISGYWPGRDTARSLAMTCLNGQRVGQVMDSWGGLHPVGGGPSASGEAYWFGRDVAVGVVLTSASSGYTLDDWGGVHAFGGAPVLAGSAYWPGTNLARGLALSSQMGGGYVLDAYGGVHQFGNAAAENVGTFPIPVARAIALAG